jgi:SAM-dependent methyltransferase
MSLHSTLKALTPPLVWSSGVALSARLLRLRQKPTAAAIAVDLYGKEKPAEWYDDHIADNFLKHYSETKYYCLWTVILDRMRRASAKAILDIGCGTGQFAALARDHGIVNYCGFDFSKKRLDYARELCPQFTFVLDDAFTTRLFDTFPYDSVVCTEVLEHVEEDLKLLERVRPGSRMYGSVPSFPSAAHVRFFENANQVAERYSNQFDDFDIDSYLSSGHWFFVFDGTKR